MTIATQICKRIYQGDGETRVWELDFPVLSATDVKILVTSANGTETVITTGYEVNLLQHTVTYPTVASGLSALATGQCITLLRVTPLTQTINLTQQGVLDAEELENGYDKLTLHVQELNEQVQRSIKYAPSSGKTDADAATFLADLEAAQTAALSGALDSVAQTKTDLEQTVAAEETARQSADLTLSQQLQTVSGLVSQQGSDITAEEMARVAADQALSGRIDQLCFIQLVTTLPETGNSKYLYAILQEDTDDQGTPLAVLYVWDSTANSWNTVGAFSTNLDPDTLLSKTEAASTYIPLSQKAATNGVASLDGNTQVPLAQLPVDSVLSSISENPVQNKVITEALEEVGYETWQKPSDWIDIRSGALPNSVYFLVAHSADYSTYPKFEITCALSNSSNTYDVFVDGVKVATTAHNTKTTLTWQTLALTSGFDVTYPSALHTHIVRVTPTSSSDTISSVSCSSDANQGVLWVHSTCNYHIAYTLGATTGWCLPILEAVTCSGDTLLVDNLNNFVGRASNLVSLPKLLAKPNTPNQVINYAFYNCSKLKKVHIIGMIQNTPLVYNSTPFQGCNALKEIIFEDCQMHVHDFFSAKNLVKLPSNNSFNNTRANIVDLRYLESLKDTFVDCSDCTTATRVRFDGENASKPNLGKKGLIVSNEAPFTGSSPQINAAYTGLDRAALVNLFNSMPTVTGSQVCNITGCTGADDLTAEDIAVAVNKGWTITR